MILINSAYSKVGLVFGDPEVVRNGEQLKRTKTLSVRFRPAKEISGKTDTGDLIVGRNVSIQCKKNKTGIQGREMSFFYAYVDYDNTLAGKTDIIGQLVDLGMKFGIISRKGAWYIYQDLRVQGLDNFVQEVSSGSTLKDLEKSVYDELF